MQLVTKPRRLLTASRPPAEARARYRQSSLRLLLSAFELGPYLVLRQVPQLDRHRILLRFPGLDERTFQQLFRGFAIARLVLEALFDEIPESRGKFPSTVLFG